MTILFTGGSSCIGRNLALDWLSSQDEPVIILDKTTHAGNRENLVSPQLTGRYHLAAKDETSWYQYVCFVLEQALLAGKNLKVSASKVGTTTTSAYPNPAKRPANSRLCIDKVEQAFALFLPAWQTGVSHILTEVLENTHE